MFNFPYNDETPIYFNDLLTHLQSIFYVLYTTAAVKFVVKHRVYN